MRSPVLIAETPFAGGHGPRFLAPPGRQVDADTAAFYLANALEGDDDAEEIEGDDYLAVRMTLTDDSTGDTAPQMLLLAGVDVDRMSGEERDEVLDQLRERLEVLNDAVLAIDWQKHEYDAIIEIPELDEWHEASWDALPRGGRWANPEMHQHQPAREEAQPSSVATDPPETQGNEDESWGEEEQYSDSEARAKRNQEAESFFGGSGETWQSEPEPETPHAYSSEEPEARSEGDEAEPDEPNTISMNADSSLDDHHTEPTIEETTKDAANMDVGEDEQLPPADEPPVILEMPLVAGKQQPQPSGPVTVIVQVVADPNQITPDETKSEPASALTIAAKNPAPAPISSGTIDPIQVSAAIDRSPALAPLPTPNEPTPARRRGLRWWVWFPWTALVVLIAGKYLYLTQLDRTWRQRVTESRYVAGPIKIVEKPAEGVVIKEVEKPVEKIIEKPVDRIVEKTVEKPIGVPIHVPVFYPVKVAGPAVAAKEDLWGAFAADYRARIGQFDLIGAAETLVAWKNKATAEGAGETPELARMIGDYQSQTDKRLVEWTASRIKDRRFADAYSGLATFSNSKSVKELLGATKPNELAQKSRTNVFAAEDEYHYSQIRTLVAAAQPDEDRLNHHIHAYLAMGEPGGRMLGVVQKLAEYRQWLKDGQPVKAVVVVDWGPRALACDYTLEIGFGLGKDGQPIKSFIRNAAASPGKSWSDTLAISGFSGNIPYRIKATRPTSPVEELAESGKSRTELFLSDPTGPLTVANEIESGTKVRVDWLGAVTKPELPEWGQLSGVTGK